MDWIECLAEESTKAQQCSLWESPELGRPLVPSSSWSEAPRVTTRCCLYRMRSRPRNSYGSAALSDVDSKNSLRNASPSLPATSLMPAASNECFPSLEEYSRSTAYRDWCLFV